MIGVWYSERMGNSCFFVIWTWKKEPMSISPGNPVKPKTFVIEQNLIKNCQSLRQILNALF
jgi:hypothetical protein